MGKQGNPTWIKGGDSPNPGGKIISALYVKYKALSLCERGIEVLDKIITDENETTYNRLAALSMLFDRGLGKPSPTPLPEDDSMKALIPSQAPSAQIEKVIEHYEQVVKGFKEGNVIDMKREDK
jgi:hypothetical protein